MLKNKSCRRVLAALGGASMLAGVGTTAPALASTHFRAVLNGDNLTPAGDTDGWGRARIDIDGTLDRICTDLEVRSIAPVTSAQIFRGGPGEAGTPVARLERPDDDDSYDCKPIGAELAQEIQANPAGFYVGVTTSEFPGVAIRGQIGPG